MESLKRARASHMQYMCDVCVVELYVIDGVAHVKLHVVSACFRVPVLSEFTPPLARIVDAVARATVRNRMTFVDAAVEEQHRLARRTRDLPARPRLVPYDVALHDAHTLYLEGAGAFFVVPGAVARITAAWGIAEGPGCGHGLGDVATPTPPRFAKDGRLVRDRLDRVTTFCPWCLARSRQLPY